VRRLNGASAWSISSRQGAEADQGLKEPQGGAYAAGLDLVYVASGGDGEDLSPAGERIKRKIRLSQNSSWEKRSRC
jgi:hypothetical protein